MKRDRAPSLVDTVRAQGGVIRQSALDDRQWSKRTVADAVAAGQLVRVRRSWLAVPDADPYLIAAARAGVVLTCVTQASRLGCWVLEVDRPHVAAPRHAGSVRVERGSTGAGDGRELGAVVHWGRPLIARHPGSLLDPVENVLVTVARCQPFGSALAVWESALRKQLVDALALARLPLPARAREILETASPFSDSGLETFVVPRLRWMKLRIIPKAWLHGHRVDFLIGDRLVLQIDGSHHTGAQRDKDIAHDANLMLRGYHVIRVGYGQVIDGWPIVQDLIMRAVAQGLHRAA